MRHQWTITAPRQLRNRCGVLTWNTSGLTQAALDEALLWADPQPIHVLVLTETRWQGSRIWSQKGWHCISSSGQPYRSCGIVTCIKPSLCTSDQIGWTELMAGRLMRIRLFLPSRSLDILCGYQYAYRANPVTRSSREQWFQLLDTTLSTLPHRNQLIWTGDLNTSLVGDGCTVGLGGFRTPDGSHHPGPSHPDQGVLQDILKQHGVVALNTWRSDSVCTFFSSLRQGSRIDFLCTRYRQADRLAKQSVSLPDWPPLPLATQGHYPVLGTIPLRWISAQGCTLSNIGYQAKERCRQSRQIDTPTWDNFCHASHAFLHHAAWPHNGNFDHQGLTRSFEPISLLSPLLLLTQMMVQFGINGISDVPSRHCPTDRLDPVFRPGSCHICTTSGIYNMQRFSSRRGQIDYSIFLTPLRLLHANMTCVFCIISSIDYPPNNGLSAFSCAPRMDNSLVPLRPFVSCVPM